ncbi:LLM class flavin-dependent oxidoreductase [Rhizobium sp. IMFF44]|uniref:LLM class flavin-dependent oxidoreductase n=1 Tax=Rhizobium sp. IMFF44 TaxID=3342350 RepID=UPI0035B80DA8
MTHPNGLRVGIGLDVAAQSRNPRDAQKKFWRALVARFDTVVDFVTLEDGFARPDGDGLDAVLLANWLAASSGNIGIIPGAAVNFLEPFHVSTAIATLDFVSEGRAGFLVQHYDGSRAVHARQAIGALNGFPAVESSALRQDALDVVDVVRGLWDSWEDGAVIRDKESQRFLDGSKLHYINFKGSGFQVLGPSITPRPPQGQPVVAAAYRHGEDSSVASAADIVFLHPDRLDIADVIRTIGTADKNRVRAFVADVIIDAAPKSVDDYVAQIGELATSGIAGIRLVLNDPAVQAAYVIDELIPALRARSSVGPVATGPLRGRFGLPAAGNRYTNAA